MYIKHIKIHFIVLSQADISVNIAFQSGTINVSVTPMQPPRETVSPDVLLKLVFHLSLLTK